MKNINELNVELFADGADLKEMIQLSNLTHISGLTTNPTLMRKSGVKDYKVFAKQVLAEISSKPISFEVFSDELDEMYRQALEINAWASNVYIKIPITNSRGQSTASLISKLTSQGIKVNVTAVFTVRQVKEVSEFLNPNVASYVSIFAGRIADTGVDPQPTIKDSLATLAPNSMAKIIWASPRELLNVFQADKIGCHIITASTDILNKLELVGKNLEDFSLETVAMFRDDAEAAGYSI
jgi:transaldolase